MTVTRCKYRTVVIDPPWDVKCNLTNVKFYGIGKKLPYKVMSDEEIIKFPINDFAAEECDLFLWTTHTKLPLSLTLLQLWGFKFHVLLTWDKLGGVCINGFYRNTELIVYGYRGKMGVDLGEGHYIPTLFRSQANGHSIKPDVFYAKIRDRTQEPRIDIFARKRHFGFDAWGDQVENQIQIPLLVSLNETKECQSK